MINDDVLYAYRLRVLASARELGSVAAACRLHGIHRSTFYRWKRLVERFGAEILRPRERRRPQMPKRDPGAHRAAHRRLRPRPPRLRTGAHRERARPREVGRLPGLCQRRLARAAPPWPRYARLRLGLLAGYAAPPEPAREPEPERHIAALARCVARDLRDAGWELERVSTDIQAC